MALRARIIALAVLGALPGCVDAAESTWDRAAISYLLDSRQPDGGFAEADTKSSYQTTVWVSLALARHGHTGEGDAYILSNADAQTDHQAASISSSNQAALTLVWAVATGHDPMDLSGVDVIGRLIGHQNESGAIGKNVNEQLVGAGALAMALGPEHPAAAAACSWVESQVSSRGWAGLGGDTWFAANAVLALAACGQSGSMLEGGLAVIDARRFQGGIRSHEVGAPDASTTSNGVQAFHAAFRPAGGDGNLAGWEAFVESIQHSDGGVPFSADVPSPRVKTTAEALIAKAGWLYQRG